MELHHMTALAAKADAVAGSLTVTLETGTGVYAVAVSVPVALVLARDLLSGTFALTLDQSPDLEELHRG